MSLSSNLRMMSAVVAISAALSACGTHSGAAAATAARAPLGSPPAHAVTAGLAADAVPASFRASALPAAGNPNGHAYVPPAARAVNTSHPNHVIGTGTAASCTSAAVVRAVGQGGIITFNCGDKAVTIGMTATADVHDTSAHVVLDGGGKVTLSGLGRRRILYMNTCDYHLRRIKGDCINQATPRLTVQNLTLTDGVAWGDGARDMAGGSGGAIFDEGGQLKVVHSRFISNRCYSRGPDLGGAAIRAFEMYRSAPVYIVRSTFTGGTCSNGGALSSIAASWTVLNSAFSHNRAIGWGANPAVSGTPGGGSGGAIYTDGDNYELTVNGSVLTSNDAAEGGGAIFYVSDDRTGTLHIDSSTLEDNPSGRFSNFPGTMFYIGRGKPVITNSHLGS